MCPLMKEGQEEIGLRTVVAGQAHPRLAIRVDRLPMEGAAFIHELVTNAPWSEPSASPALAPRAAGATIGRMFYSHHSSSITVCTTVDLQVEDAPGEALPGPSHAGGHQLRLARRHPRKRQSSARSRRAPRLSPPASSAATDGGISGYLGCGKAGACNPHPDAQQVPASGSQRGSRQRGPAEV